MKKQSCKILQLWKIFIIFEAYVALFSAVLCQNLSSVAIVAESLMTDKQDQQFNGVQCILQLSKCFQHNQKLREMIVFDMTSQRELLRLQEVKGYSLIKDVILDDLFYIIFITSSNSIKYCQISEQLDLNFKDYCQNKHHLHHSEEVLMVEEFSGEITYQIHYISECGAVFYLKIIDGKITTKQVSSCINHLNINDVLMFSMIEMNEPGDEGVSSVFSNKQIVIVAFLMTNSNQYPEIQLVCSQLEKDAQYSTLPVCQLSPVALPTSFASFSRDSLRIWRLSQNSFCFLSITPNSTFIASTSVFLPSNEKPLKILEDIRSSNTISANFPGYNYHSTIGFQFIVLQLKYPLKSQNQAKFMLIQVLFDQNNRNKAIQFESSAHTSLQEIHQIINQQGEHAQHYTQLLANKVTPKHIRSIQQSSQSNIITPSETHTRLTSQEEKEKIEKTIKAEVSSNTPKIIKIVCGIVGGIVFVIFLVIIIRIVRSHLLKNAQERQEQQQNQIAQQQQNIPNNRMQLNQEQPQQHLGQQQPQLPQQFQPLPQAQQQAQQIPMDQQQIQQFIQNNNMIFSLLLNSQNLHINNEAQGGQLDSNQQQMLISALLQQQQQQQQLAYQSNSTSLGIAGQNRKESSSENHDSVNVLKQLSHQSISRIQELDRNIPQNFPIQRQQEQETVTDHHHQQEKDEYYNNREHQELPYLSAPLKLEQINPELSINQSIDKLNINNISQINNDINIHNEAKIGQSIHFQAQNNNSQLLREKFEKELIGLLASQLPNLPSAELQQQQYLSLQRIQQAAQFILPSVDPPPEYEQALEDHEEEDENKEKNGCYQKVEKEIRIVQDYAEKRPDSELNIQEKDLHENVDINGQNYELKQPELEKLNRNQEKKNVSQLENEKMIEDAFAKQPRAQPSQRPQRYADMKDKLRKNQEQQQYNPLGNIKPDFSTDAGNLHDDYFNKFSNKDHIDDKHQALCGMCLCNPPMMFFDCGHVLCQACTAKVKNCPFCQLPITNTQRIAFV